MSSLRPDPTPRAEPAPGCGAEVGGTGPLPQPPIHDADVLLAGGTLALITLGAQTYQLRLTRHGKLILNK